MAERPLRSRFTEDPDLQKMAKGVLDPLIKAYIRRAQRPGATNADHIRVFIAQKRVLYPVTMTQDEIAKSVVPSLNPSTVAKIEKTIEEDIRMRYARLANRNE